MEKKGGQNKRRPHHQAVSDVIHNKTSINLVSVTMLIIFTSQQNKCISVASSLSRKTSVLNTVAKKAFRQFTLSNLVINGQQNEGEKIRYSANKMRKKCVEHGTVQSYMVPEL